jgi:hypothetical protein
MEMKSTWPFCGEVRSVKRMWGCCRFPLLGIKLLEAFSDHPGSSAINLQGARRPENKTVAMLPDSVRK